jgi:hypothetical protein
MSSILRNTVTIYGGHLKDLSVLLVLVVFALSCSVSTDQRIIPSNRLVDWNRAGVWVNGLKGIPNRTVIFCNVRVSIPESTLVAVGNGVQDDTAALRAAISACPAGQVVFIPGGTYRISGTLSISRGIVVRGEGSDRTKIIQYASQNIFFIGGGGSEIVANISSGYSRGSDTLVLSNGNGFDAGSVVMIDQLNDPALVTSTGSGGLCSYCGRDGLNGTRAMAETLLVKERTGNTIKLNRPLYYDYKAAFQPQLSRRTATPVVNAGIENLYIEAAPEASDGDGIRMANCVYCWVRDIESYNTAGKHMEIRWGAYGNEVRESYFHHAQSFGSNAGYGVDINNYSTDNLIENNAFYYVHTGIELGSAGGSGNVLAYNYVNTTRQDPDWFQVQLGSHGAHCYMNLFEGNVAGKVHLDNYWGSGSHAVFFRNRITRQNPDWPVHSDIVAVIVDAHNYYMTFVGNIIGTPSCSGPTEQTPFGSTYNNPVLWKIGYDCCSGTGNTDDTNVAGTLIRTGNWECTTNAIQWSSSERSIPDSLYLSAKPAWFGVLDWPPFTPERSGFNPNNVNKIPAQVRFENGPAIGLPWATSRGY